MTYSETVEQMQRTRLAHLFRGRRTNEPHRLLTSWLRWLPEALRWLSIAPLNLAAEYQVMFGADDFPASEVAKVTATLPAAAGLELSAVLTVTATSPNDLILVTPFGEHQAAEIETIEHALAHALDALAAAAAQAIKAA